MKLGQLIECNIRNIFIEKSCAKYAGFDTYYKIVVRDHVWCQDFGIHDVYGQIPKSLY